MSNKKFRVDAKSFCLTYSNPAQQQQALGSDEYTLSHEKFHSALWDRLSELGKVPAYYATCVELHESGELHFHAGINFDKRWNLRDPRALDIDGIHPNIQGARDFRKWVAYLKKCGNFIEVGELDEIKEKTPRVTPEELIEMAKTMDQANFLAYCSVHRYMGSKDIWSLVHEDKSLTLTELTQSEGTISDDFKRLSDNFSWNKHLTLLIVGESGIGKANPNTTPNTNP